MTDETDQRYLYRVVAALDALGSELARVRVRGRGRGRGRGTDQRYLYP